MPSTSVADVVGPWVDSNVDSGLIARCKAHWATPVGALPDLMVATYLNQQIAVMLMIEEAKRRLAVGRFDDTELYDSQLQKAVDRAKAAAWSPEETTGGF